jgi:phage recombination protein Bet
MSTDIAVRGQTSDLAITDGQTFWTDKQIAGLRALGVENAGNGDLAVFFHQAVRTGLDPFAKQIYMIGRWSREGTKWTIQTGIDGYRLIARRAVDARSETLEYEDTLWCGEDGRWVDVWLSEQPPAAAKVTVLRDGRRFSAVALWREYVQTVKDKQTGELKPNSMWERMGSGQLAKCAEALALRKAFPQDLSGIYTTEEMGQADSRAEAQQVPPPRTASQRLQSAINRSTEKAADQADVAADVVTGEVVDDQPPASPGITRPQLTALNAALTSLGYTERPAKLAVLSGALGREVGSSSELTKAEASDLIDRIQRGEIQPPMEEPPGGWDEPPADFQGEPVEPGNGAR